MTEIPDTKKTNDRPAQLERCSSCNAVMDPHNGDCRCS